MSVMLVTKGPGRDGRVDAEPVEGQGHEDAAERREDQDRDEGKADDDAELRRSGTRGPPSVPMMTAKTSAVEEADHRLAADDAPGIGAAELAGGERADGHRHGLRAGIAAHGGDDGHEDGERHHLLQRALEERG